MLRVNRRVPTDTEPLGLEYFLSQQTCANCSSFRVDSSQGYFRVHKLERNS